jgi:isoleucyl-tRNA synthetase
VNTKLTKPLIQEGLMRDLVRHIQQFRKDLDLPYTQKINLNIVGSTEVTAMVNAYKKYIMQETLSESISFTLSKKGETRKWSMNNTDISIEIQRIE